MRRFDVAAMFASLWLLASMIVDIATPKELTVYMIGAATGLRDGNRADHAEAVVAVHRHSGGRTDSDRRHRDPFPKLATFEAKADVKLAGFDKRRLRLGLPRFA
jgi:hypothetical protein